MAAKDATAIKAALALAIVDLNLAIDDATTAGQMANIFRDPKHPIRDLNKLFLINGGTGQLTVNDAYIDEIITNGGRGLGRPTAKNTYGKVKVPYSQSLSNG